MFYLDPSLGKISTRLAGFQVSGCNGIDDTLWETQYVSDLTFESYLSKRFNRYIFDGITSTCLNYFKNIALPYNLVIGILTHTGLKGVVG